MRPGLVVTAAIFLAFAAGAAHAGNKHKKHGKGDKPWADGVSEAEQKKAFKLFDEGNRLMEQQKWVDAEAKFEDAIQHWDHPNIEFNIAVCLMNTKHNLEAYDHIEKALEYGDAPLGTDLYRQALTNKNSLEGFIATIVVKTTQDGVTVTLDGKQMMEGAAEKSQRVEVGQHQIAVSMKGYETDLRNLSLKGGERVVQEITLDPEKVKVKTEVVREGYERRFPFWVPYAVGGGGILIGLIGGGVYYAGYRDMRNFDQAYAEKCPAGCTDAMIPASLKSERSHAQGVGSIGDGLFVAGGIMVVAGAVLVVINRPTKKEESKITPSVNATDTSVTMGISFRFE